MPSFVAGAWLVDPMKIAHVFVVALCATTAVHPSAVITIDRPVTPVVATKSLGAVVYAKKSD